MFRLIELKSKENLFNCLYSSKHYNTIYTLFLLNMEFSFCINKNHDTVPTIVYEDKEIIFIELNNNLYLFSYTKGLLFMSILYNSLDEIIKTYNGYLVITESSFILISSRSYNILNLTIFPDYIVNLILEHDKIKVSCVDENYEIQI